MYCNLLIKYQSSLVMPFWNVLRFLNCKFFSGWKVSVPGLGSGWEYMCVCVWLYINAWKHAGPFPDNVQLWFSSKTLAREDMGYKAGGCPPGSFWGAFPMGGFFLLYLEPPKRYILSEQEQGYPLLFILFKVKEQGWSSFEYETENLSSYILVSHLSVTCDVTWNKIT